MPHSFELTVAAPDESREEIRELLPLVYDELKRLAYASAWLSRELRERGEED